MLTSPAGGLAEMVTGGGVTTRLSCAVAVLDTGWESATCTVKLEVPTAAGVPEMTPALLRVSPAGRLPELMLHE